MKMNISACTLLGNYPAFISVNQVSEVANVEVTVRSGVNEDGSCGTTSSITLDSAQFAKLVRELSAYAGTVR